MLTQKQFKSKFDRVILVANDAGGANILSSWANKSASKYKFITIGTGPAKDIFELRNFRSKTMSFSEYLKQANKRDVIITGTSDTSKFERNAVKSGKNKNIYTVSFLDHWINYEDRFFNKNKKTDSTIYLPDEIWVGDKYAYAHALSSGFLKNKLRLVPNPYFQEIIKQRTKNNVKNLKDNKVILFMSSPVFKSNNRKYGERKKWSITEYDQLESLLKNTVGSKFNVLIRMHPKEKKDKYKSIIKKYRKLIPISISNNADIISDIKKSDIVIGGETMGLVVALFLGKKVYSIIPKQIKEHLIPYKGIKVINSMEDFVI